ncbi:Branched-chain amino acid transport ATP-binding protein LivF (TC 3.A.1.4.1) [hydrothermal vent metagenome]|uniref:Branched-chain amino acid transport ATP-binding protein LivF (TC 3.A.1.4.1) n=1 Tax=hydrothermal vent metagenome TaxID=652676 RepID=A0A3B1C3C2_9ZZZZ
MLEVEGLNVFYGDMQALWDVSFEVREKEVLVLLGANGAGKSTILRTLSGLSRAAQGSVTFNGVRLDQIPADKIIQHGLVHVPEGRRLFPEMTVEENLIMGSLAPEPKRQRQKTLERVYGLFPRLRERMGQYAGTLSGGEQQMVAVGRGLMGLPKILMLDEPSLGLSPLLAQEIFKIIRLINSEGVTILLVEQNVKQSLKVCSRAYVLENGRITLSGTGEELSANDHVKQAYLGI